MRAIKRSIDSIMELVKFLIFNWFVLGWYNLSFLINYYATDLTDFVFCTVAALPHFSVNLLSICWPKVSKSTLFFSFYFAYSLFLFCSQYTRIKVYMTWTLLWIRINSKYNQRNLCPVLGKKRAHLFGPWEMVPGSMTFWYSRL